MTKQRKVKLTLFSPFIKIDFEQKIAIEGLWLKFLKYEHFSQR